MDSKTETVSDNELIARFMGWTQHDKVPEWMNVPKGQDEEFKAWKLRKDSLMFDTSWDWLMPVVEKISQHIYESWEDSNGYKNVTQQ